MTAAERAVYVTEHPDHYIDATDLTGAAFAPGFGPDAGAGDDHQFDHDAYREELGMTERDYADWTRGKTA